MYKDRNGNIIKVGDTLLHKKLGKAKIENIKGVTVLVFRRDDNSIKKTIMFSKVDLAEWEKAYV